MLHRGWAEALIVTTEFQWAYLGWPEFSGFFRRCESELGYRVGELRRRGRGRLLFRPVARVHDPGFDDRDP